MRTKTGLAFITTVLLFTSLSFAQDGGRLPATPTKTKPETDSKSKPSTPKQAVALDHIDGRWWTSGNDFGASEVVFSQNGNNVQGEIHYVDGRTGIVKGTFANKRLKFTFSNSAGVTGSGWLELSWPTFLGGPWRNATVKDGSWTLHRIEGQWCLNGNRSQVRKVTHDVSGRVIILTPDGTQESGALEGPYIYLDSAQGRIKGDVLFGPSRIAWADGTSWKWCGR